MGLSIATSCAQLCVVRTISIISKTYLVSVISADVYKKLDFLERKFLYFETSNHLQSLDNIISKILPSFTKVGHHIVQTKNFQATSFFWFRRFHSAIVVQRSRSERHVTSLIPRFPRNEIPFMKKFTHHNQSYLMD